MRNTCWSGGVNVCSLRGKCCAGCSNFATSRSKLRWSRNKFARTHNKFARTDTKRFRSDSGRRDRHSRLVKTHDTSGKKRSGEGPINPKLSWTLREDLSMCDLLGAHESNCRLAQLAGLRIDLDDSMEQVTNAAASQEAIAKLSMIQVMNIKGPRNALEDGIIKPIAAGAER